MLRAAGRVSLAPLAIIVVVNAATAQPLITPKDCSKLTFVQCESWIRRELEQARDFAQILSLAAMWNKKYEESYIALKAKGMDVRSHADIEKIENAVADKISPIVWAKNQARDAFIKQYLPRVSVIMKYLGSLPGVALQTFLWPSQTATEFDELISSNKSVHSVVMKKLDPYLKTDWDKRYIDVLQDTKPPGPTIGPKL
jgi:hypothetical protein